MKSLIFSIVFCWTIAAYAQTINTDRPTQSASPYVLPQGRLQWETGALFQGTDETLNQYTVNNSLFRYGLFDGFEARLTFNYEGFDQSLDGAERSESGFSPVVVGFKSEIAKENGFWPQVGFVGQVALPTGEEPFRIHTVVPAFRFTMLHNLSSQTSIGYNWGMEWVDEANETTNIYTLIFNQGFADSFAWFFELYGFIGDDLDDHRGNTGFTYLVNDKLQLDLSGGFGISDVAPDYFISGGISLAFIK